MNKDKDYISAVNPTWYQKRYRDFMRDQVFVMQTLDPLIPQPKKIQEETTAGAPLVSARETVKRMMTNNAIDAGPQDSYLNDNESMLQHSINRESAYSQTMSKKKY